MRTGICAALIASAFALSFTATPASAQVRTIFGGNTTCGGWLKSPGGIPLVWIMGYLSRAAFEHPGDMLEPVDADAVKSWVDNYCEAHPLDKLSDAVTHLEIELAARSAPKTGKP